MIVCLFLYLIIAFLCSIDGGLKSTKNSFVLWIPIFFTYSFFVFISNCYIDNPLRDYFITSDQIYFYTESLYLSNFDISEIFERSFTDALFSESPLAIFYFAVLSKFAKFLDVTDILLFQKLNVAFIASLIPLYVYKLAKFRFGRSKKQVKQVIAFSLLSPLLILSCQLLRDIHVCFIYTLSFYVLLNQKVNYRYIKFTILVLFAFLFRIESGLFLSTLIFVPLYGYYKRASSVMRIITLIFTLTLVLLFFGYFYTAANETIQHYTLKSVESASSGSLGVLLEKLPFPLNILSKTIFAQLLPFPLWFPFQEGASYSYLRIVECFFPFYWIAILYLLFMNIKRIIKDGNSVMIISLMWAISFLLLCSASEFNTRRLLAVYPIIFFTYIYYKSIFHLRFSRGLIFSVPFLLLLHFAYILIKN